MENSNHQLGKDIILPSCIFSMRFWSMPSELINELPGCRYTFFQDCRIGVKQTEGDQMSFGDKAGYTGNRVTFT